MQRIPDFARDAKVRFTFDGRTVEAYENESLASAILASGKSVLSRSIRYHRPRTMFCSTGECGWCAVEVNGESNVPACMQKCRAGLKVRSQNAWPSAEWDLFSLLNLFRFRLTNTFYHHHLFYPKFMRQFYLRCLRFFTGVGRVHSSRLAEQRRRSVVDIQTLVVVIGGGLTGLKAAITVAEQGERVILVDRNDPPDKRKDISGSLPAWNQLLDKIKTLPQLEYWSNSICIGIYEGRTLGIITPDKLVKLHAQQIILAVGALDAIPLFTGNDLPGVVSARLAKRLILNEGMSPGKRAILWGTTGPHQDVASILPNAGIEIVHQLQTGESIVDAKGCKEIELATIRSADGSIRNVTCDLIVVDMLQPRNELLAQAGGRLQWDKSANGLIAMRDNTLQSSIEGLRVVGEAAGSMSLEVCLLEARLAGLSTLQDLGTSGFKDEIDQMAKQIVAARQNPVPAMPDSSCDGAGYVCFCEDVMEREIRFQMSEGYHQSSELIKRRTAIFTGTCQGKYCRVNAMLIYGVEVGATTARPPAMPIRVNDLLIDSDNT